jgi:hypothetical protein
MNEAPFTQYMAAIGLSSTLAGRADHAYELCAKVCPEKIEQIFVNDYIDQEGARVFQSIYFFSTNYIMEAKGFVSAENYDLTAIEIPLKYLNWEAKDFDFTKATEKSRLTFYTYAQQSGIMVSLKASKENCDYLWELIRTYFLPRAKK